MKSNLKKKYFEILSLITISWWCLLELKFSKKRFFRKGFSKNFEKIFCLQKNPNQKNEKESWYYQLIDWKIKMMDLKSKFDFLFFAFCFDFIPVQFALTGIPPITVFVHVGTNPNENPMIVNTNTINFIWIWKKMTFQFEMCLFWESEFGVWILDKCYYLLGNEKLAIDF